MIHCFVAVQKQSLFRLNELLIYNTSRIHLGIDELVLALLQLIASSLLFIPHALVILTNRRLTTVAGVRNVCYPFL